MVNYRAAERVELMVTLWAGMLVDLMGKQMGHLWVELKVETTVVPKVCIKVVRSVAHLEPRMVEL